jgi:hypothetical protein
MKSPWVMNGGGNSDNKFDRSIRVTSAAGGK